MIERCSVGARGGGRRRRRGTRVVHGAAAIALACLAGCAGPDRAAASSGSLSGPASGPMDRVASFEPSPDRPETSRWPVDPRPLEPRPVAPEPAYERVDWTYLDSPGSEITTPHFRLYTTIRESRWLERLPGFYERCMALYTSHFGTLPSPARPLSAYIFRDHRQWRNKTREILPEEADAFMTLGRGGFTTQGTSVLYFIGGDDTLAIAAHEGWHQYTQGTFKHPLPIWLEEGLAAYMEAAPQRPGEPMRAWDNDERRSALARAVRREQLFPLRELLMITPQSLLERGKDQLLTYYAQVWALAWFLVEGEDGSYRAALEELLSDAAHGRMTGRIMESRGARFHRRWSVHRQIRNGPLALTTYIDDDLQRIEDAYDRFVATVARTRGPLPKRVDEPRP